MRGVTIAPKTTMPAPTNKHRHKMTACESFISYDSETGRSLFPKVFPSWQCSKRYALKYPDTLRAQGLSVHTIFGKLDSGI